MTDLYVLAIQTGLPTGGPALLDMDDEHEEALQTAIRKVNKARKG